MWRSRRSIFRSRTWLEIRLPSKSFCQMLRMACVLVSVTLCVLLLGSLFFGPTIIDSSPGVGFSGSHELQVQNDVHDPLPVFMSNLEPAAQNEMQRHKLEPAAQLNKGDFKRGKKQTNGITAEPLNSPPGKKFKIVGTSRRNKLLQPRKPSVTKVMMISYSFDADLIFGQLLNMDTRVLYFEDPLLLFDDVYRLTGSEKGGEVLKRNVVDEALSLLDDAFECQFNGHRRVLTSEPRMLWDIRAFRSHFRSNCDAHADTYDDDDDADDSLRDDKHAQVSADDMLRCLEDACKASSVIALRCARLNLRDMEKLWNAQRARGIQREKISRGPDFESASEDPRLLLILRDPRAILYRGKMDGNLAFFLDSAGGMHVAARDLCSRMLADVNRIDNFLRKFGTTQNDGGSSEVLLTIKEENFLRSPDKTLKQVYDFLGISQSTKNIKANLKFVQKDLEYSKMITRKWGKGLKIEELVKIDEACGPFYKTGYYSPVTETKPVDDSVYK